MKFVRTPLLPLLLGFFSLFSPALGATPTADESFLAARDAVRSGERGKLERLASAPELQDYPLQPYVDYWRLLLDLNTADPVAIRSFLARHENTYVAARLRADWLKFLARKQQWAEFDAEYPALAQPDQELTCNALQSRMAKGDARVLDDAVPLWLNLVDPPEGCYPVLEALIIDKRVLADEVWARIRRQFEANKLSAARYSMNYLPPSQTPDARTALAVSEASMSWLAKTAPANTRLYRELAALAIARLARNDPRIAAEQLERLGGRLHSGEKNWAWSQIAWQAALRHWPEAQEWFGKAAETPLSEELLQWKVRAALRVQDWGSVRSTIEKMPSSLSAQPVWVYWLGRAYRAGGRLDEASALYRKIAGQANFYGNLADEELGRPIAVPPKASPPSREEMGRLSANISLQRALALLRLNMRVEGVREWNWGLRGLNDRELLAAAEMAKRAGVYDRAIAAAERTQNEHDFEQRYLSPYSEQVRPAARNQSLDDAWVYGLMRQESRFVTQAKSSVGAAGLMQLMPETARWVAKKLGLKDFKPTQVHDTETNLMLGTAYMRMVLESLGNHPLLASAAYNAGPGRARRWQAEVPLEGAIYAETIPFSETRDYVKKVMSNAVYYSALFDGRPQSLKNRLGVVDARVSGESKSEYLP